MGNSEIKPCPICGSVADAGFLFDKKKDGRGEESISLYRCGFCKTVYLAKYNEFYDDDLYAYYKKYEGMSKEELFNSQTRKSYIQVLRLLSSHFGGKSILDVGCGKGDFVDAALNEGYKAEDIELAQHAVDIAQGFGLPVSNLNFFSTRIEESSKDVVTIFEVIEHLPNPSEFLRRAEAVVKPGGLIYITTPNFNSLDRRVLGSQWNAVHREHLCYFTPRTLLNAIQKQTSLELLHLETRNVSEDLIGHIKNIFVSRSRKSGCSLINKSASLKQPDLRTKIDKSQILSLAKLSANQFLNATSLGSTIVMLLRRPEGRRENSVFSESP